MFQLIIVIWLVPGHNNSLYLGRAGCPHPGTVTVVCVYVQQTGRCLHTAINDQMTRKHTDTEPWTISKISNSPCLNVCLQNCYWLTRCQVFVLCPSGGSWWPGLASTVTLWQKKRRLVKIWPQARCWCWCWVVQVTASWFRPAPATLLTSIHLVSPPHHHHTLIPTIFYIFQQTYTDNKLLSYPTCHHLGLVLSCSDYLVFDCFVVL